MKWRIYYGDGSTYSDQEGSAWDAPVRNVIALAHERPNGTVRVMHSKDAFVFRSGRWYGVDTAGLWDYLLDSQGATKIIFGRWVHDEVFDSVMTRARAEETG